MQFLSQVYICSISLRWRCESTTVAGLLVAIPSMFAYNWLVHTLRVRTVELDNFAQDLVSKMETEYLKEE